MAQCDPSSSQDWGDASSKHRAAALICNQTLEQLLPMLIPGAVLYDLCSWADTYIQTQTSKVYTKHKFPKGISYPTSICRNNCVGGFTPLQTNTESLEMGDTVKIDIGCHIDGYSAELAVTHVIHLKEDTPDMDRLDRFASTAKLMADALCRLFRSGTNVKEITSFIHKTSQSFGYSVIDGSSSYQLNRYMKSDAKKILYNQPGSASGESVSLSHSEVYAVNIMISTGKGKTILLDEQPTVFRKCSDETTPLKTKAARHVLNQINARGHTLPFHIASMGQDSRISLGITELLRNKMIQAYPVKYESQGEHVAHFKYTVLLAEKYSEIITGLHQKPGRLFEVTYSTESQPHDTDPDLAAILKIPIRISNQPEARTTQSEPFQRHSPKSRTISLPQHFATTSIFSSPTADADANNDDGSDSENAMDTSY